MKICLNLEKEEIEKLEEALGYTLENDKDKIADAIHTLIEVCMWGKLMLYNKKCSDCAKYETCKMKDAEFTKGTKVSDLLHDCTDYVEKEDW